MDLRDIYLGGRINCQELMMDKIWRGREEARMIFEFLASVTMRMLLPFSEMGSKWRSGFGKKAVKGKMCVVPEC